MKKFWFWIAGLFLILLVTNRWPNFEQGADFFQANDTRSYLAIAESFPSVDHLQIPYHHYQRLFLPFLVGGVAHILGCSIFGIFRAVSILLCIFILFVGQRVLSFYRFTFCDQIVLISLLLFNPYVMRYYLAVPVMSEDLLFMFGEILLGYGLLCGRISFVYVALLLAILGRQTTLLLLPAVTLWIFLVPPWSARSLLSKIWTTLGAWLSVIGTYQGLIFLAHNAGVESDNIHYFFGMFHWLKESFTVSVFVEVFLRTILPFSFLIPLILLILYHEKKSFRLLFMNHLKTTLFLFFSFMALLQPILGDPIVFWGSLTRYSGQAYIFGWLAAVSVSAWPLLAKPKSVRLGVQQLITIAVLIVSSFHHIYSYVGFIVIGEARSSSLLGGGLSPTLIYAFGYIAAAIIFNFFIFHDWLKIRMAKI